MEKVWRFSPKIKEDILLENPGVDPTILQLLANRGVIKKEEIDLFLRGDFNDLLDPFLFNKMEEAVSIIIKHIKAGSKICIFGDYDADGITSSALLFDIFTIFKANTFVYIPDRVKEGYGFSREGLEKIMDKGVKMVVTVDGGIRNKEEVKIAQEAGIEVVITDHHPAPEKREDLPDCVIINPQVKWERYPNATLAGVGVAFKLAQALIERSKLEKKQKDILSKRMLDLVAVGTVADCMVLLGENRILVKKGLEVLNNTRRLGLIELIKVSGIEGRELQAWNIGFQIAPRLNASSRMASAVGAFDLLVSKDKQECRDKALDLDKKNASRQRLTEEAVAQVEKMIVGREDDKIIIGIAPEKHPWNEGIVGLVAGKITEKYYKPCLIITKGESEWKGSGRSIDEFNLAMALEEAKDLLLKNGGHAKACGLSLEKDKLDKFSQKIRKIAARELSGVELKPKIMIDAEISISDIKKSFIKELRTLAPFGQKNPEPKFLSKDVRIIDIMRMGADEQHIKLRFSGVWAIGFNLSATLTDYRIGDVVDVVYTLEMNEFNGREEPQMKIIDIRLSDNK